MSLEEIASGKRLMEVKMVFGLKRCKTPKIYVSPKLDCLFKN